MHPINKKHFGPEDGKIAVRFHDGSTVVDGHIVKQLGTHKFRVSDGTTTVDAVLAPDASVAASLTSGFFTIPVETSDGNDYVTRLTASTAVTASGDAVSWVSNTVASGLGKLLRVGESGGGGAAASPKVSLDFKTATYLIDGANVALEDAVAEAAGSPDTFAVTGGEGVSVTANGAFQARMNMELTPTAAAALLAGYVGVFTVKMDYQGGGNNTNMRFGAEWNAAGQEEGAFYLTGGTNNSAAPFQYVYLYDNGDIDQYVDIQIDNLTGVTNIVAVRFAPDELAISPNGLAAQYGATTAPTGDSITFSVQSSGNTLGTITLERADFYLASDVATADLQNLSTVL